MPNGDPAPIQVRLQNDQVTTVPFRVQVTKIAGAPTTLTWVATIPNTVFPTGGAGNPYFQWKDGSSRPIPNRISDTTLELTYASPAVPEVWRYSIWLQPVGGTPVEQDPEIDNQRPPTDEDPHGKGKGHDKDD